jgi:DNA-binding NarL/FixJ family response regulator
VSAHAPESHGVTKVVVAGDIRVCREALARELSEHERIRVIGTFPPWNRIFAQVADLAADIALVDMA